MSKSFWRLKMKKPNYGLHVSDFKILLMCLTLIASFAIPIGLATGFLEFKPLTYDLNQIINLASMAILGIAVLEETIFRGLIMGLLWEKYDGQKALIISTLLFGAMHSVFWGWEMVVISTYAGYWFGYMYLKTRRLGGVILLHGIVILLWQLFLV